VGISTISFAFVCQHNSFIVFRTLKERTYKNWEKVARTSISFSFVLCAAFGISGYLSFREQTKGDVLNNFPKADVTVNVARALLGFSMLLTYPMECFVSRHCFISVINRVLADRAAAYTSAPADKSVREGDGEEGEEGRWEGISPMSGPGRGARRPATVEATDGDMHIDKLSQVTNMYMCMYIYIYTQVNTALYTQI
jgi:hypothetical protein